MKQTLQELNEYAWYRALKVFYILMYLPLIVIGPLLIWQASYETIPPSLPESFKMALEDRNFYDLNNEDMLLTLELIDEDFRELPNNEKRKAIIDIRVNMDRWVKEKRNYVYFSRRVFSVQKAFIIALLSILFYVVILESIRRAFYYIVTGKINPKQ